MSHTNIEIKARSSDNEKIRKILTEERADYKGTDHQIDTYFKTNNGRLKLREGNIENYLIFYDRENKEGPKQSDVILLEKPDSELIKILNKSLGTLVEVDKQREIYFIENVKFHLDNVRNLGTFMEIEAIDFGGNIGRKKLLEQCDHYMKLFGILGEDLIDCSYSDLLMEKGK